MTIKKQEKKINYNFEFNLLRFDIGDIKNNEKYKKHNC